MFYIYNNKTGLLLTDLIGSFFSEETVLSSWIKLILKIEH